MGLTVWALPEDGAKLLGGLVEELATITGTPAFTPHITLVSAENAVGQDKIRQAMDIVVGAHTEGPISISVKGLQTGPDFFQSVLLAIDKSDRLAQLQYQLLENLYGADGAARWQGPNGPKWFPHISLAYAPGLVEQLRTEKLAIARCLSKVGVEEKSAVEAIEAEPRSLNVPIKQDHIKIGKIVLVDCDCSSPEAISTWKIIYERDL